MKNKYTIYIPSKSRFDIKGTIRILEQDQADYFVVVEKEEEHLYRQIAKNILVLPESNKGISYSRNWIKKYSKLNGEKFHWQMDDDITSFCVRFPGKSQLKVSPIYAIKKVEEEIEKYNNVSIAGLNFNSFPPGKIEIKYNKPLYRCFIIKNDNDICWRNFSPLEDWDYSMQILKEGYATMMFDYLRTNSAKPGTLKGGLKEVYEKENIMQKINQSLLEIWSSENFSIKNNRIDAKQFFKKYNNPLTKDI